MWEKLASLGLFSGLGKNLVVFTPCGVRGASGVPNTAISGCFGDPTGLQAFEVLEGPMVGSGFRGVLEPRVCYVVGIIGFYRGCGHGRHNEDEQQDDCT